MQHVHYRTIDTHYTTYSLWQSNKFTNAVSEKPKHFSPSDAMHASMYYVLCDGTRKGRGKRRCGASRRRQQRYQTKNDDDDDFPHCIFYVDKCHSIKLRVMLVKAFKLSSTHSPYKVACTSHDTRSRLRHTCAQCTMWMLYTIHCTMYTGG